PLAKQAHAIYLLRHVVILVGNLEQLCLGVFTQQAFCYRPQFDCPHTVTFGSEPYGHSQVITNLGLTKSPDRLEFEQPRTYPLARLAPLSIAQCGLSFSRDWPPIRPDGRGCAHTPRRFRPRDLADCRASHSCG